MPPKKQPKASEKPLAAAAGAGKSAPAQNATKLPSNDVKFKFNFQIKHERASAYQIKLFWLNPSNSNFELASLGILKEWVLKPDPEKKAAKQAEQAAAAAVQPPAPSPPPAAKGKKPSGAAAPAPKKAAAPAQQDLDENQPHTMLLDRELDSITITQDLCYAISTTNMKLLIYRPPNTSVQPPETEPVLVQTIELDLSPLLFIKPSTIEDYYKKQMALAEQNKPNGEEPADAQALRSSIPHPKQLQVEQHLTYIKTQQIEYIDIKVSIDQPLLSQWMHKKLNPMRFNLLGVKDLPAKNDSLAYKPVYGVIQFYDNSRQYTRQVPQHHFCKFARQHTFLLGKFDYVFLREMLDSHTVKVEIHDCRQVMQDQQLRMKLQKQQLAAISQAQQDTPVAAAAPTSAKPGTGAPPSASKQNILNTELLKNNQIQTMFNHGCAKFLLKDFLKPHVRSLKLRSNIFPVKKKSEDINQNLNLNTTAKMSQKVLEKAVGYLSSGSFAVMGIDLAYPIGMYLEQQLLQQYNLSLKQPNDAAAPTPPPPEDDKAPPQDIPGLQSTLRKTIYRTMPPKQPEEDYNQAIFQRIVYIYPYKSPQLVKSINDAINQVNLKALGITDGNLRYLTTKQFSEEERKNRSLDIIGGFQVMDNDFRMLIIQGLGGEGHGVHQFYNKHLRNQPNSDRCKLLYNPEIRFKNRAYLDFNVTIKKIKFRINLAKLMASPDVYLRAKVPQEIYDTLRKISDIQKYTRIRFLKDYDLFPTSQLLLAVERKYGDSLSHQDLYGVPKPKRKKYRQQPQDGNVQREASIEKQTFEEDKTLLKKSIYGDRRKEATDTKNEAYQTFKKQKEEEGNVDFINKNKELLNNMRHERAQSPRRFEYFPEGQEVHMYASQKLNFYDFQKEELRKKLAHDKNTFFTYSKEYLSLAFPMVNEHEIAVKAKQQNHKKWLTEKGFINIDKKDPADYNKHPKQLHQSILGELKIPYHQAVKQVSPQSFEQLKNQYKQAMKKFQRGAVAHDLKNNKPFDKNIGHTDLFSSPQYFKTVHLSGDDQYKQMQQDKQKEIDDWQKKVVVKNQVIQLTLKAEKNRAHQYDRLKDILQDKPSKKGLTLSKTRVQMMRDRGIAACRKVNNPPISIHMKENYQELKQAQAPKSMKKSMDLNGRQDFNINITTGKQIVHKMSHPSLSRGEMVGPKWGKNSST